MLLGNDLFSANSKLRDPIKMVYFDGSQSPVTDSASPSQSVSRQMPEIFGESAVEALVFIVIGRICS